ncbi:hypothetical protein C7974DRAFT_418420 [Boeremia exigua]|uniref:uncharacterized protein n=1 Tax=Boeremia exigua TaxID=749465 RepID=UPI001E8E44FD|nr:uncharacterized protein C7974DRAFT_418420 [Boeremia exigua]KAH6612474.1 hypothetical protein C7974DRAFT_418420 [Boeremia exigua]
MSLRNVIRGHVAGKTSITVTSTEGYGYPICGCQSILIAVSPIMDPRLYFLRAVQHRFGVVVQSHEYLVRKLEEAVEIWVREHDYLRPGCRSVDDHQLEQSLRCIGEMTKLFRRLHQRFSRAIAVWNRFSGQRGDIQYFDDLQDGNARYALLGIEQSVEMLTELVAALDDMLKICTESAEGFDRQLKHSMSRVKTDATTYVAESAAKSEKFAEEMSRFTRLNVQLLMVTTAVVIALQYFCSERALFKFERSPRMFWVSICVLVPSLLLLTYILHAVDQVRKFLTDKLAGKQQKAVTLEEGLVNYHI